MLSKRSCVIVGLDGFDPDVLANLVVFYGACGFDIRISAEPGDCDLLVLQRGRYESQIFEARARSCHIYDYAGMGSSDFHLAFPNVGECVVIAPGPRVSGKMASPQNVVRSFHPVIAELWRVGGKSLPQRPYEFVHIGHRKAAPPDDAWLMRMNEVARGGSCHFWGKGWRDIAGAGSRMIHGCLSLHGSQRIYRQSRIAIGVMYPFQRGITISGRMWQAPLNGCALFSEAMIPDCSLPGVAVCRDYEEVLHNPPAMQIGARMVDDASEFWTSVTRRLAGALGLDYRPPRPWTLKRVYSDKIYLRHVRDLVAGRLGHG